MVWLSIGYGGRTSLVFLGGGQKHIDFIQELNSKLLPYASELGEELTLEQNRASIHIVNGVKWFAANNVQVLPLPAKYPVLYRGKYIDNACPWSICW